MIILSVGGSLINPGKPDMEFIKGLSRLLVKAHAKRKVAVVAGGGAPARTYANAIRELGGSECMADMTAVFSTRQNGSLLVCALGKHAWPSVAQTFEEAARGAASGGIVVMGGTIPGITTDTDAALLAELLGAERIVNVSNVDGIYTEDPRKSRSARKIPRLGFRRLVDIALGGDRRVAGENFIFDLFACKIIARSGIEAHFVGPKLSEVEKAINGKRHSGTIVRDD